jgi:S1-C subfamily serine protease
MAQTRLRAMCIAAGALVLVTAGAAAVVWTRPAPPPASEESAIEAALREAERAASRPGRTPIPPNPHPDPAMPPDTPPDALHEEKPPQPDSPPPLEEVVRRVSPAVVLVETPAGRGTAFFVSPDTLLTNVHVIRGNSSVTIRRSDGTTLPARVERQAPDFDVAVLKIANPLPSQGVIKLGSALNAPPGREVIAIGSPLGMLQNTVTRGIVSALRQSGNATLVQTDAAVNPGNSGGPLLDRDGTAIGITTMGFTDRQGLSFAVAIDHAKSVLEGRLTSSSAAASGSDLKALSPAVLSDHDEARAAGQRELDSTLGDLARRADALEDYWRRFRASCYAGTIAGSNEREWFAVLDSRRLQGSVSPGCESSFDYVVQQATRIRDAVLDADERARRADVLPGVRRDVRQKYRFGSVDLER